MKGLDFKSQELQVDFMVFNFPCFDKKSLIEYFWYLNFDVVNHFEPEKNSTWVTLQSKTQNQHQVVL